MKHGAKPAAGGDGTGTDTHRTYWLFSATPYPLVAAVKARELDSLLVIITDGILPPVQNVSSLRLTFYRQ